MTKCITQNHCLCGVQKLILCLVPISACFFFQFYAEGQPMYTKEICLRYVFLHWPACPREPYAHSNTPGCICRVVNLATERVLSFESITKVISKEDVGCVLHYNSLFIMDSAHNVSILVSSIYFLPQVSEWCTKFKSDMAISCAAVHGYRCFKSTLSIITFLQDNCRQHIT